MRENQSKWFNECCYTLFICVYCDYVLSYEFETLENFNFQHVLLCQLTYHLPYRKISNDYFSRSLFLFRNCKLNFFFCKIPFSNFKYDYIIYIWHPIKKRVGRKWNRSHVYVKNTFSIEATRERNHLYQRCIWGR